MKKIISLILCTLAILIIYFIKQDNNKYIAVYLDNIEGTSIPNKNSNYIIDKIICDNDAIGTWDNVNWGLLVTNLSKRSNCKLYFRSKQDITITYDNNYDKDNIFSNIYDENYCGVNGNGLKIKHDVNNYNGSKLHTYTAPEYNMPGGNGLYMTAISNGLTIGTMYYYSFEAKITSSMSLYIGSEQGGLESFNITPTWKKYSKIFKANSNEDFRAFIFYNWPNNNTLEIRNLELQEGEYNNFSATILKEYDNINNTLPTPTRENYTFLGWYTDPIEGEKISSETIVTEDTTYYAHWQYNESE